MERSITTVLMFFLAGIFLLSCEKDRIEMPDFDARTDSDTYGTGEEITFHFTGDAQNIAFWSGEQGHIYANKNRTAEQGVIQTMQFTSLAGAGAQNDNLSVLVSTDFNGVYDAANLAKATWTDITARAVLSSTATSGAGTSTSSGSVDISDFGSTNDKPIYFAFRYVSESDARKPRQWTISAFNVINRLADGTANNVIASLSTAGFQAINIQDENCKWALTPTTLAPTSMTLIPGNAGAPVNEDWVVSAPVKLNKVSLADYGVSVISISTLTTTNSFTYTYKAAGIYNVTFYAFNENLHHLKSIVKELTITVTP